MKNQKRQEKFETSEYYFAEAKTKLLNVMKMCDAFMYPPQHKHNKETIACQQCQSNFAVSESDLDYILYTEHYKAYLVKPQKVIGFCNQCMFEKLADQFKVTKNPEMPKGFIKSYYNEGFLKGV